MYSIRMARSFYLSAAVVAGSLVAVPAGPAAWEPNDEAAISLHPAALRLVAPPPEGEAGTLPFFATGYVGTTLALRVQRPAGGLLVIDTERTRIEHLSDDTGNDLLAVPPRRIFPPGPHLHPTVGDDGKAAVIEIAGGGLPIAEARAVRAAGVLVLRIGTELRTGRQEAVPVAEGARIDEAGPIRFSISELSERPGPFGDLQPAITLRARQEIDEVADIRFLDADGEEVASRSAGRGRRTSPEGITVERTYVLNHETDALTFEIDYWAEVETVELPFDVEVTIGGWQ